MMKKTLKYFYKPKQMELDVPVTTKFPKDKFIWNIGEHNPYIKDGYVILATADDNGYVIPASLEFLYVNDSDTAALFMDVASVTEVSISNLDYLENYDQLYKKDFVHKVAHMLKLFI